MPLDLPHDSKNPDKGYAIFLGVRMWSCASTRDPNPISASCLDNQDDRRGEASIASQELKVLDDKRLQTQHKSSSIKLGFPEPSIRKSENEFSRKATLS